MAQAATLVVHTGRSRMSARSTSGSTTRSSQRAHSTAKTAAAAKSASTRPEVQPQELPSLIGSSSASRVRESSTPPTQSMRARTRTGDSGTHSQVASAASAVVATESQKIHEIEPWSTNSPASTSPDPPPMPNMAETVPIAGATRSRGNSSRMMPMASGKMAPPAPWIARPAIITASERGDGGDQRADAEDGQ